MYLSKGNDARSKQGGIPQGGIISLDAQLNGSVLWSPRGRCISPRFMVHFPIYNFSALFLYGMAVSQVLFKCYSLSLV